MPGIRITRFAGLAPELDARAINRVNAQVAHNCLLWDGSLRPMPLWKHFQTVGVDFGEAGPPDPDNPPTYFVVENTKNNALVYAQNFYKGVLLTGQPFANGMVVGIDNTQYETQGYLSNLRATEAINMLGESKPLGLPNPASNTPLFITASSLSYISTAESNKPVNRIIGISFCRRTNSGLEESTIAVLPNQAPYGIMFEGDIVQINLSLDMDALAEWGITHIRLYRTISGMDSGEQIGKDLDADWHLISTIAASASIAYNDGGAATTDPLDLYLAGHFYAPRWGASYFGLTESGYFYCATTDGVIAFSERYLHHAWPTENELAIPEGITDVVHSYDNVYIGTNTKPYHIAVSPGEAEQGLQAAATPFSERLPCIGGSMTAVPGGALYASRTGLVALSQQGAKVVSAGITKAGDVLYKKVTPAVDNYAQLVDEIKIERTTLGAYHNGSYYGFQAGKEPVLIPGFLCYERPSRFYGYAQVDENDLSTYKFALGTLNQTTGLVGDVATANVIQSHDYYGDLITDGEHVFGFATADDPSYTGERGGLYAMRVNLKSQELEKIAVYIPPPVSVDRDRWSIQDIAYVNGKIFMSLFERKPSFLSNVYMQVLTFDGVNFALEYSVEDPYRADFYEVCNGRLLAYGYNDPDSYYRLTAYSYSSGAFTELNHVDFTDDIADNGIPSYFGRPLFIDGNHIYVNNMGTDGGPQILNFDGSSFSVVMPHTTWPSDYCVVTGGDGLLIAVKKTGGYLTTAEVFKWDGATPAVSIQTIPCFEAASICYDKQEKILYVPGYGIDTGEVDKSGVYKWNADTEQFDKIVPTFLLSMMRGFTYGFTHTFRMLEIQADPEVCEADLDTYYAYILNNNGVEEFTKEVKVAYGKFNVVAQEYFDMCVHYFKGTKVYTTGGIAVHDGVLFACTGSVFGYAVTDDTLLDKPALVALLPNATTGDLDILARYEAPYNSRSGSWSISGPAIDSNGYIYVVTNDDNPTHHSTLRAFTYAMESLTEVGTYNLPGGWWDGNPVFMHGDYVMVLNKTNTVDTLRAFTFDGSTFTPAGSVVVDAIQSDTGHENIKSNGNEIFVVETTNIKVYTHNGSGFTLIHTLPVAARREWLAVAEDAIFVGDTSTNLASAAGFFPVRKGEVYRWDGSTLTYDEAYDFGITEFANVFYDNASKLLFVPTASGFRESGLMEINDPDAVGVNSSGIYQWVGGVLTEVIPHFALGHRINSTLDNSNNCIAQILPVPNLHRASL